MNPRTIPARYMAPLRVFHIIFGAMTFGGLVSILSISLLKNTADTLLYSPVPDRIIYQLNNTLVFYGLMGSLFTALIYSLYTKWGFFKYRWILLKWILLLTTGAVFMFLLSPGISGTASLSDSGLHLGEAGSDYLGRITSMVTFAILLITLYLLVIFISTIKPFKQNKKDLIPQTKITRRVIEILILVLLIFIVVGSISLNRLRNLQIADIDFSTIKDGHYVGTFHAGGGTYTSEVDMYSGKIIAIKIRSSRQSQYVRYAGAVVKRMIDRQKISVDAITGATTTSKCIMKSVENALK